ncbi:MAG: right-handed parallel beta-helix repeat-containing protein [Candidatus Electryoneaceae bacterium]|nr:right-handed parallel beta-helix repeat-containing protein [Candidatus Electryoneaceae bacterium]
MSSLRSRFSVLFAIVTVILLFFSTSLYADTLVSGEVAGEWLVEDGPYIVNGHLIVPDGEELVIEAGLSVFFNNTYRFTVEGRLEAVGTEDDSIFFGPVAGEGTSWGGFRLIDADSLTHLSYCILRAGRATGNDEVPDSVKSGANVFIYEGDVLIENCRIYNGLASNDGGGISVWAGSPAIRNCLIHNNVSQSIGGGMGIRNGSEAVVQNCVIHSNTTNHGGGGMQIRNNANPVIEDCLFQDNISSGGEDYSGQGGALYIRNNSSPTFRNCQFVGNNGFIGGAVHIRQQGTNPLFENCDFYSNAATGGSRAGGAFYIRQSAGPIIRYCRFIMNGADWGGAIYYADEPRSQIHHNLFTGNGATRGGGAVCTSVNMGDEPLVLTNCTFVNNLTIGLNDPGPNTIWARSQWFQSSNALLSSCIVLGEEPHFGEEDLVTVTYSHVQGGYDGEENSDEYPMFFNDDDAEWFLLSGLSSCVDSGDPDLPEDSDGSTNDRGWLHFPQNALEEMGDDTLQVQVINDDCETVTVMLTNTTNVPYYATPIDRWMQAEPDVLIDVSEITDDHDIYGVAWTPNGYYLSGGNGDSDPQIYHLDNDFELVDQFEQPGYPDGNGFFDLATDGESVLYGGDDGRIIEFTTDGELGLEYGGPEGLGRYTALGADFVNAHGFVDYYLGGPEGIIVRADGEMWERQRFEIGDPISAIGVKGNMRGLYILTEPDEGVYSLSSFNPDDSRLTPLYDLHPPMGHRAGGFEISQGWEAGRGKLIGIWQGDSLDGEPVGDKLYVYDIYTSWMEIHPEQRLLMPGDSVEWEISIIGGQTDEEDNGEYPYLSSYKMIVNGWGAGGDRYIELNQVVSVDDGGASSIPTEFGLSQAYPNPFNSSTTIHYQLPMRSDIEIKIFDASGREIEALVNRSLDAGNHRIVWNGAGYPSGLYFCRMVSGDISQSIRLLLIR